MKTMARFAVLVAALLLAIVGSCYGQDTGQDACSVYDECNACISAPEVCVWCSDLPPFSGPRCTSRANANCTIEVEDPVAEPPVIILDDDLGDDVQIAPQELHLQLRAGVPQTFTLSVKPSRNYPLDMYFLMDLSGSLEDDLARMQNLSSQITEELESISSEFRLGFGSFVDKVAYPYASTIRTENAYLENDLTFGLQCVNGRDQCNPTYSYRHQLSLTNISEQFAEVLDNATIQGNLDSPEGGLDALVQALTCSDIIGWRSTSLKLVMFLSDAGFKTALDGKVGAVIASNDGLCHLEFNEEGGFYEYLKDLELDYPSIYQVRQLLIDKDVIIVFAIIESRVPLYEDLAKEIGISRAFTQEVQDDSSDIVDVIRRAYESVTQNVVVDPIDRLQIDISPGLNCNLTADGTGCADVTIEQLVTFNVSITMTQCLDAESNLTLSLPGFGSVALRVTPLCECNCSSQVIEQHEGCNGEGDLTCGICTCNEGFFGEYCDCDHELRPCEDDCFNRGICDNCSRVCTCTVEEDDFGNPVGSYGERCQCDNTTTGFCLRGIGTDLCSDRGRCVCNTEPCGCTCECGADTDSGQAYFGSGCECDPDNCYNADYPNRLCALTDSEGNGTCGCDGCSCPPDYVFFDRTCMKDSDICTLFEPCARCGINCTMDECNNRVLTGSVTGVICQYREDGCIIDFIVVLDTRSMMMMDHVVYVGEERDCSSSSTSNLPWIIAVAIVGGILVLGVLALIIAKIILVVVDRRDYKKFIEQMNTAEWAPHDNPLYVTPQTEYKNPLQRMKRRFTSEREPAQ